jgi:hypothetical protein
VIENPDPQEPWQVRTVAYHYTFGESGGNEILSYEEHPQRLGFRELSASAPAIRRRPGTLEVRESTPVDRPYHPGGLRFVRLLVGGSAVPPARDDWEAAL